MKQYKFGEVTKTLKQNTYYLEEKAKEAAGLTDEREQELTGINKQYQALSSKMEKGTPEEKIAVEIEMERLHNRLVELNKKMAWYLDFNRASAVLDVLLVGGSEGITAENVGRNQAKEVWADFFI
jgi:hypothetical protein